MLMSISRKDKQIKCQSTLSELLDRFSRRQKLNKEEVDTTILRSSKSLRKILKDTSLRHLVFDVFQTVNQKIDQKRTEIKRSVDDPNEIILLRRIDEGKNPIFDRDDIKINENKKSIETSLILSRGKRSRPIKTTSILSSHSSTTDAESRFLSISPRRRQLRRSISESSSTCRKTNQKNKIKTKSNDHYVERSISRSLSRSSSERRRQSNNSDSRFKNDVELKKRPVREYYFKNYRKNLHKSCCKYSSSSNDSDYSYRSKRSRSRSKDKRARSRSKDNRNGSIIRRIYEERFNRNKHQGGTFNGHRRSRPPSPITPPPPEPKRTSPLPAIVETERATMPKSQLIVKALIKPTPEEQKKPYFTDRKREEERLERERKIRENRSRSLDDERRLKRRRRSSRTPDRHIRADGYYPVVPPSYPIMSPFSYYIPLDGPPRFPHPRFVTNQIYGPRLRFPPGVPPHAILAGPRLPIGRQQRPYIYN